MAIYLKGEELKEMPPKRIDFFNQCMEKLSAKDFNDIIIELHRRIDKCNGEIISSHVPSQKDWSHDFKPINDVCEGDIEKSGWFFGLLFWRAAQLHPDKWEVARADEARGKKYTKVIG